MADSHLRRIANRHKRVIEGLSEYLESSGERSSELDESLRVLQRDRDLDGNTLPARADRATTAIDRALKAHEGEAPWTHAEVTSLLGEIREMIAPKTTRAERAELVLDVQKRLGCQKTSKQNCWKHGGYWNGECHRAAEIADLELRNR
jgi:hypothetical protein